MLTVNERLSTEWLRELRDKDEDAFVHENYVLYGSELEAKVKCEAAICQHSHRTAYRRYGTGERYTVEQPDGKTKDESLSANFVFCFACNRVEHATCANFNVNKLTRLPQLRPRICKTCTDVPNNEVAVNYYQSQGYLTCIWDRANAFLKAEFRKQRDDSQETSLLDKSKTAAANDLRERYQEEVNQRTKLEVLVQQQKEMLEQLHAMMKSKPASTFAFSSPTRRSNVQEDLAREFLNASRAPDARPGTSSTPTPLSGTQQSRNTRSNQRQSILDSVVAEDLELRDRIRLEQAHAQQAAAEAQYEISRNVGLETIRKSLPKIRKFDGDVTKWIPFKEDVERYKVVGEYDDRAIKNYVHNALEGIALSRVRGIINTAPLARVMQLLEDNFGDPTTIVEQASDDILAIRLGRTIIRDDVVAINTKIQTYFTACKNGGIGHANSHQLARHIFNQLSYLHKMMYRQFHRGQAGNAAVQGRPAVELEDLETLYEFFESLRRDLERKRPDTQSRAQVHVTTATPSTHQSRSRANDAFEMRDKDQYPFGYDMGALSAFEMHCEQCGLRNHYTVQCRQYKSLDANAKLRLVNEKRLCKCCIIATNHYASDCHLSNGCGLRVNGRVCALKHHFSLHRQLANNNNYNNNNNNRRSYHGNGNGNRTSHNGNQQLAIQAQVNPPAAQAHAMSGNESHDAASQMIQQAPNVNSLPRDQVNHQSAFGNRNAQRQSNQSAASANHSAWGNAAISLSTPPSADRFEYDVRTRADANLVSPLATNRVKRTVKVFKNTFLGATKYVEGYSIGDSAAEVSLMREDLRQALHIPGEKCDLTMQYADGTRKTIPAMRVTLMIQGKHDNAKQITLNNVYAIEELNLPRRSLNVEKLKEQFPYLRKVKFESYTDIAPLLLIGSPHASVYESRGKLYEDREKAEGKPVGLLAKLGWSIYGGDPDDRDLPFSIQSIQSETGIEQVDDTEQVTNEELAEMMCYSNSIESLGIKANETQNTQDEQKAIDIITEEMRVLTDGSIELPLVWNRDNNVIPHVPNNFPMVYRRQIAHERKLAREPSHLKAFNDNFIELLEERYVRPATQQDFETKWPNVLYLPMSLVINKNKDPPKFRNVFDASAKYLGTSLNENLLKGPDLLIDQLRPLLHMRADRIAFTADVKAMFMRMKINLRDQQCQRVLWRPHTNTDMKVFVVTSMLFGPTCSPFASQFVKNVTAERWEPTHSTAAQLLKNNVYMDDLLTSLPTVEEAARTAIDCIEIFSSINLHLIGFQSNSRALLQKLPEANVKAEAIATLENENASTTTKVLGCQWSTKDDCFTFKFDKTLHSKLVKGTEQRPTKRDQCSSLARIYDIFGFIVPFTIRGKMILQLAWLEKTDWDQPVSEENFKLWRQWILDIANVAKIKVRRQYNEQASLTELGEAELHTFCDAGGEAFAAVSYIVTTANGVRSSNIAMARAKVTPIRMKSKTQVSQMPRLELYACLIAARLTDTITRHLAHVKLTRHLWTDSLVALRWITNPNHKLIKYAIAPVEEILDKTTREEWRYVPSRSNVADKATKFTQIDFADSNAVWFTGPGFLRSDEKHWPTIDDAPSKERERAAAVAESHDADAAPIVNAIHIKDTATSTHTLPTLNSLAKEHLIDTLNGTIQSRFNKLVRATARGLKIYLDGFIPLIVKKQTRDVEAMKQMRKSFQFDLTAKDLERAEHFLIRKAQREYYPEEYERLSIGQPLKNTELMKLQVFLDEEGLMRINSRVQLPGQLYPQQFAPLIPRKSQFALLLMEQVHYDFRHAHLETQIASIRTRYWIPQLRAALSYIKNNCNFCQLMKTTPPTRLMAPLPECRTDPQSQPFETVSVDCLGPITIKHYGRPKKYWVMLFTCTLTRFIHLHLLESLKTVDVLEAISVYWAAHGPSKRFISDRGTNFKGAARVLKEERDATIEFLQKFWADTSSHLIQQYKVDWQFLPAHAPWMGGVHERMVKEVKRSIASVLEDKTTTRSKLNFALHDAAHRINCRPLTHNAVEAEDSHILTPHDLAKNRSGFPYLPGLPDAEQHKVKDDVIFYRKGRALADELFRRFTLYYLPMLTKRTKWFARDDNTIRIGDLVLLIEPNDTRKEWKRARVLNLYKGRDGRQRVADVILPDGTIRKGRAVHRLARIDIKTIDPPTQNKNSTHHPNFESNSQ